MKRRVYAAARTIAVVGLLAIPSASRPAVRVTCDPSNTLSKLPPEVRLRKLHLVRPDLIQYPISYEVYC